ncbi:type II toxin-antitoxin system VapC family toxin [Actinoallomurus acanthiterrae]
MRAHRTAKILIRSSGTDEAGQVSSPTSACSLHAQTLLQPRVLELRHDLTAYDAMYVALAEALNLPLLTDDAEFAAAAGHLAEIHHYPN